ncbi:SAM-dependent methyltransferase [Tsukamurella soli]|uniref:SAM-dependent methyltransferase n=1 Tax=Tsukamurella soli TaxID=644556 RepID=A0ABP8JS87_9ACTN
MDLSVPSVARVYDYFLGGAHNFPVDREMARQVIAAQPDVMRIVAQNRLFLQRAVRFLGQQGIRQFLDIGSGIPTVGATHEVARAAGPGSRVVYVDLDPVALAHSATVLDGQSDAIIIDRDLRRPGELLADPELHRLLDLDQPIAILVLSLAHFLSDTDQPATIFSTLRDACAPGSYLAVSAASRDDNETVAAEVEGVYARTAEPMYFRTRDEFASLYFPGYDLVEPGLVRVPLWRPASPADTGTDPEHFPGYAGVGRLAGAVR